MEVQRRKKEIFFGPYIEQINLRGTVKRCEFLIHLELNWRCPASTKSFLENKNSTLTEFFYVLGNATNEKIFVTLRSNIAANIISFGNTDTEIQILIK